jgi:hypothetical protein
MTDIDDYVNLLSQQNDQARERVMIEAMEKTGDTRENFDKKNSIIAFIVTRLSSDDSDDTIIENSKSVDPQWNVDLSDINLVKSRFEEVLALSRIESEPAFTGITTTDVDNFVKIFLAGDVSDQQKTMLELIDGGAYTFEELMKKMEVMVFISRLVHNGIPESIFLQILNEEFPKYNIVRKDIDAVLAQKEQVKAVARKLEGFSGNQ